MVIIRCDDQGMDFQYKPVGENLALQTWVLDVPKDMREIWGDRKMQAQQRFRIQYAPFRRHYLATHLITVLVSFQEGPQHHGWIRLERLVRIVLGQVLGTILGRFRRGAEGK